MGGFFKCPGWRRGRVTSRDYDSHSLRVFLIDEGRHAEVINRPGTVSSLVGKKWENLLKYPPAASKVGISGEKKILPTPFHKKSATKWNFCRSNSNQIQFHFFTVWLKIYQELFWSSDNPADTGHTGGDPAYRVRLDFFNFQNITQMLPCWMAVTKMRSHL